MNTCKLKGSKPEDKPIQFSRTPIGDVRIEANDQVCHGVLTKAEFEARFDIIKEEQTQ
jgi:hypothetical protein